MVRRRTASPKASAPSRSFRAASPPSTPSYQAAPRPAPPAHATPAPAAGQPGFGGAAAPPSQGPGLMAQMAATAGGVAIGSAVGHAVGNMFTGGSSHEAAPVAPAPVNAAPPQTLQQPCEIEWRQFLECSQTQPDLNLCQSYNDLFKQCKVRYGA